MNSSTTVEQTWNEFVRTLIESVRTMEPRSLLGISAVIGITLISGLAIVCFSGSSISLGHGLVTVGSGSQKTV